MHVFQKTSLVFRTTALPIVGTRHVSIQSDIPITWMSWYIAQRNQTDPAKKNQGNIDACDQAPVTNKSY
jgi:hypothetical protein